MSRINRIREEEKREAIKNGGKDVGSIMANRELAKGGLE